MRDSDGVGDLGREHLPSPVGSTEKFPVCDTMIPVNNRKTRKPKKRKNKKGLPQPISIMDIMILWLIYPLLCIPPCFLGQGTHVLREYRSVEVKKTVLQLYYNLKVINFTPKHQMSY
jgi:hypothetical protein